MATYPIKQLIDENGQPFVPFTTLKATDGADYFLTIDKDATITAKYTFNTLPESGLSPTTNNQLSNKKYVDDAMAGGFVNATYDGSTGVITFTKKDGSTVAIDLPMELLIQSGAYDSATKSIILTLANGDTISISMSDLSFEVASEEEIRSLFS